MRLFTVCPGHARVSGSGDVSGAFALNSGLPLSGSLLYRIHLHFSSGYSCPELCLLHFQAKKCRFSSRGLLTLCGANLGLL